MEHEMGVTEKKKKKDRCGDVGRERRGKLSITYI